MWFLPKVGLGFFCSGPARSISPMATMENQGDPLASGSKGKGKLEDLMQELVLKEDDLDDVIFEDEEAPAEEALRWMILARVHMDKGSSLY